MKIVKTIKILGIDIAEKKAEVIVNEKEIEEAKRVAGQIWNGVNQAADFMNKNGLVEPALNGTRKLARSVLKFSLVTMVTAVVVLLFGALFFGEGLMIPAALLVVMLVCRVALVFCAILVGISCFLLFCVMKR